MKIRFIVNIIFFVTVIMIFSACKHQHENTTTKEKNQKKEALMKVNKYLVKKDIAEINNYAKLRNWKLDTTSTGIYYMIYHRGNGRKANSGDWATVRYKVSLLDGTMCYSTDSTGSESFQIGKRNVETGLDDGILLMHVGDKARFFFPPHIAYGLLGDRKKIPPRSVIIYDLSLEKLTLDQDFKYKSVTEPN